MQRYDENPDGTILKTEVFDVGIRRTSNETRLARNRYSCEANIYFSYLCLLYQRKTVSLHRDSVKSPQAVFFCIHDEKRCCFRNVMHDAGNIELMQSERQGSIK